MRVRVRVRVEGESECEDYGECEGQGEGAREDLDSPTTVRRANVRCLGVMFSPLILQPSL